MTFLKKHLTHDKNSQYQAYFSNLENSWGPLCCTYKKDTVSFYIWNKKKRIILDYAFCSGGLEYLDKIPNLKEIYKRCKKKDNLTLDTSIKIAEKIKNVPDIIDGHLFDFLYSIFFKYYDDEDIAAWEKLYLIYSLGKICNFPSHCYPDNKQFISALGDDEKEKLLLDEFASVEKYYCAIAKLYCVEWATISHIEYINLLRDKINKLKLASYSDICKFRECIIPYLNIHGDFTKKLQNLRPLFEELVNEESVTLTKSIQVPEDKRLEFEVFINTNLDTLRQELVDACTKAMPKKFDAKATLALLDRISPPLGASDRALAEQEILKIESSALAFEDSPLLNIVFPILRGEKQYTYDQFNEKFPDFPYSFGMFSKLISGKYVLSEDEAESTNDIPAETEYAVFVDGDGNILARQDNTVTTDDRDSDEPSEDGHVFVKEEFEEEKQSLEAETNCSEEDDTEYDLKQIDKENASTDAMVDTDQQSQVPAETYSSVETATPDPSEDTRSQEEEVYSSANSPDLLEEQSDEDLSSETIEDAFDKTNDDVPPAENAPEAENPETLPDKTSTDRATISSNSHTVPAHQLKKEEAQAESQLHIAPEPSKAPKEQAPASPNERPLNIFELNSLMQNGNMGKLGQKLRSAIEPHAAPKRTPSPVMQQDPPRSDKEPQQDVGDSSPLAHVLERGFACIRQGEEGKDFPVQENVPLEVLFERCIEDQNTPGLYWLSKTLGDKSPMPIWLAELLHLSTHLLPRFTKTRVRINELCNTAVNDLQDLNQQNSLLLTAAILRPVIMTPDSGSMLAIISSLTNNIKSGAASSILTDLRDFITRGLHVEDVCFLGKNTDWKCGQVRSELEQETQTLLQRAQDGRTSYQKATRLRKQLFSPSGVIGKQLRRCSQGEAAGLDEFLEKYSQQEELEKLIPKDITSVARNALVNSVREAVELILRWRAFLHRPQEDASYAEQLLNSMHQKIATDATLRKTPEGEFLADQMEVFYLHALPEEPCEPVDYLSTWPLRTAGSWQSASQPFTLPRLSSICLNREDDAPELVAAALVMHTAAGRLDEVKRFLTLFPEYADQTPDRETLEQYAPTIAQAMPFTLTDALDCCREHWEREFTNCVNRVNEHISDCYFRGAIHYAQQSQSNSRCSAICSEYQKKLNKEQGIKELHELDRDLENWDEEQRKEVHRRLSELRTQAESSREALTFLKNIGQEVDRTHVYSAAWDNIARLEGFLMQQGELPVRQINANTASYARTFYERLANCSLNEPPSSLNIWREASVLRMERNVNSRFTRFVTELVRWLGFTLDANTLIDKIFETRSPHYWRILHLVMDIPTSPLPLWGSRANHKQTVVLGWNVNTAAINTLMTNGYIQEKEAVTLICFNPLSVEERQKILSQGRSWPTFPLIVDSYLAAFMAENEDNASRVLFEVALAGAPYNPYTPGVAGAVPKEMFFGREQDRSALLDANGPCLIYGGRQLGKSALLQQIHKYNSNERTRVILHTMLRQETSLLDAILNECVQAKIVGPNTTKNTLAKNIREWLTSSGCRLIVLLDECDAVLDEDGHNNFKDVWELRNLMQDSGRNFKVVFTGLHSVQRFSNVPNSPFYHFGDSICIGPLSTDAAYRLLTEPMRLLGLEFETEQLVQMALNHCNYHPKIIQMFCSELVDAIEKEPTRGPLYTIDKATILKVYESQNLKQKIRECFNMTLNLDPRYLVIGYTMALRQDRDMSLGELLSDLRDFWPAAFEGDNIHTLQNLLHEMEGLGLVISLGGSYRLRTPNVVELLGGLELVEQELEQYSTRPWQPEGDPDELRMDKADIFVASQYNLLAEKSNRLCWISGSPALGLGAVQEALENICDLTSKSCTTPFSCIKISANNTREAIKNISSYYGLKKNCGLLFWLTSQEFPYMADFIKEADKWLNKLRSGKQFVKIVCVVGPDTLYDFIRNEDDKRLSSYQMPLIPWTENAISRWCQEMARPGKPHDIMQRTSGWPALVRRELGIVKKGGEIRGIDFFAPNSPDVRHVLQQLQILGDVSYTEDQLLDQDLLELEGEENEAVLRHSITLLHSLHVLREKDGKLSLDPIVIETLKGDQQ